MFPAGDPYAEGMLDVGDGQLVHWTESGNPEGAAAVVLHGGPGSGSSPFHRCFFDPTRYRIVQFDQRGCGQSTPHASNPAIGFETNTLDHLLRDIEALRVDRGIDRWLVFGMSWGTTLGLAYAQTAPDRVTGLVVVGAALGSPGEVDWLYKTIAPLFPEQYERFVEGLSTPEREDVVSTYRRRVEDPDPAVHTEFARRWTEWDWATSSVKPSALPLHWAEAEFQLARARICTHYFTGDVLVAAERLTGADSLARLQEVPGVIINGRLDLQCPSAGALELHRLWTGSELVLVDSAGHSIGDPGMDDVVIAAIDRLASA